MISCAFNHKPVSFSGNRVAVYKTLQKLTQSRKGIAGRLSTNTEQSLTNMPKPSLRGVFDNYAVDVSRLSMHFPGGFPVALVRKVKRLLNEDHWDIDDALPQKDAMLTLLRALLIAKSNTLPSVGSDGKGSLSASWIVGKNRLTLNCYNGDEISFVLGRERPNGEIERAAGITKVQRLNEILSAYDPEIWFR